MAQQKWKHTFIKVEGPTEDQVIQEAAKRLDEGQDEGWEYLSGPEIQRYPGGATYYVFLLRKPVEKEPSQGYFA